MYRHKCTTNQYRYDNNYYQDDNRYSYDKKDQKSSHTDIQKINCGNSNVNVNGVDVTEIPQDNTALGAANEGGPEAANTENGNGLADRINFDRNLVNVCANVNDNEQTKVTPTPVEEPTTTLSVSVTVECNPGDTTSASAQACDRVETEITPNLFQITILLNNNANPTSFAGSTVPVIVTLDPGDFSVSFGTPASVFTTLSNIETQFDVTIADQKDDMGHCSGGFDGILEGESLICDITQSYTPTSN